MTLRLVPAPRPFIPPPALRRSRPLYAGMVLPSGEVAPPRAVAALEAHATACARYEREKKGGR